MACVCIQTTFEIELKRNSKNGTYYVDGPETSDFNELIKVTIDVLDKNLTFNLTATDKGNIGQRNWIDILHKFDGKNVLSCNEGKLLGGYLAKMNKKHRKKTKISLSWWLSLTLMFMLLV